jgi:hypothetical protein
MKRGITLAIWRDFLEEISTGGRWHAMLLNSLDSGS